VGIIEAARSTGLELLRGLTDAEDLRVGIAVDGAREGDSVAGNARIGLSANSELAVALRAKVVILLFARGGNETIALGGDGRLDDIVVVVESTRARGARLLLNGLTS